MPSNHLLLLTPGSSCNNAREDEKSTRAPWKLLSHTTADFYAFPGSLPGHLFDKYRLYKLGTASVVKWMVAQSKGGSHHGFIRSVHELEHLHSSVLSTSVEVPVAILKTLRASIVARTQISQFFRQFQDDDVKGSNSTHEYFTDALRRLYSELRVRTKPAKQRQRGVQQEQKQVFANGFDCLECYEPDAESDLPLTIPKPCYINNETVSSPSRGRCLAPVPEDTIGEYMALQSYLKVWNSAESIMTTMLTISFTASQLSHQDRSGILA